VDHDVDDHANPGVHDANGVRIVGITAGDWRQLRALRLEMLADTPSAFVETVDVASSFDEQEWRFRAHRAAAGGCGIAAVAGDGRWVGTMSAHLVAPATAHLVGVYVTPAHRGTGLASAMLAVVVSWARAQPGTRTLALLVHEHNGRAAAFYTRHGFTGTGRAEQYPLDRTQREWEMTLPLT
jgi:RimJ/RimL family protein N-acetyltransferase